MNDAKSQEQFQLVPDPRIAEEKQRVANAKRDKDSTKRVRQQRTQKDMEDAGAFVEQFIANGDIQKFPVRDEDVLDENREIEPRPNLWLLLTEEIDRAFKTNNRAPAVTPSFYANMLLRSRDIRHKCEVIDLPSSAFTPDRLLAHVQAAPIKLDPSVASSVARRACLVLLNRERLVVASPPPEPPPQSMEAQGAEVEMCMDCGAEFPVGEEHACPPAGTPVPTPAASSLAGPGPRATWRQEPRADPPEGTPEVRARRVIGYVRNLIEQQFSVSHGIGKEPTFITMPAGLILEMVEPNAVERADQEYAEREKKWQLVVVRWEDKARRLVNRTIERASLEAWTQQEKERHGNSQASGSGGRVGSSSGHGAGPAPRE